MISKASFHSISIKIPGNSELQNAIFQNHVSHASIYMFNTSDLQTPETPPILIVYISMWPVSTRFLGDPHISDLMVWITPVPNYFVDHLCVVDFHSNSDVIHCFNDVTHCSVGGDVTQTMDDVIGYCSG